MDEMGSNDSLATRATFCKIPLSTERKVSFARSKRYTISAAIMERVFPSIFSTNAMDDALLSC
jgi:hypothetical protein